MSLFRIISIQAEKSPITTSEPEKTSITVSKFNGPAKVGTLEIPNLLAGLREISSNIKQDIYPKLARGSYYYKRDLAILAATQQLLTQQKNTIGSRKHHQEVTILLTEIHSSIKKVIQDYSDSANKSDTPLNAQVLQLIEITKILSTFDQFKDAKKSEAATDTTLRELNDALKDKKTRENTHDFCLEHAKTRLSHTSEKFDLKFQHPRDVTCFSQSLTTADTLVDSTKNSDGHRPSELAIVKDNESLPSLEFYPITIPKSEKEYSQAVTKMGVLFEKIFLNAYSLITPATLAAMAIKSSETPPEMQDLCLASTNATSYVQLQILDRFQSEEQKADKATFFYKVMKKSLKNRDFATAQAIYIALSSAYVDRVIPQKLRDKIALRGSCFETNGEQKRILYTMQESPCIPAPTLYLGAFEIGKESSPFKSDLVDYLYPLIEHTHYMTSRSIYRSKGSKMTDEAQFCKIIQELACGEASSKKAVDILRYALSTRKPDRTFSTSEVDTRKLAVSRNLNPESPSSDVLKRFSGSFDLPGQVPSSPPPLLVLEEDPLDDRDTGGSPA